MKLLGADKGIGTCKTIKSRNFVFGDHLRKMTHAVGAPLNPNKQTNDFGGLRSGQFCDMGIHPHPHLLFRHPRSHLGCATPQLIRPLIATELYNKNELKVWYVLNPSISDIIVLYFI